MAKILLVDDDKDLIKSLSEWLRLEEKHTVENAFDGREAVDFLAAYEFDVVVLDWEMPYKSGIDVCRYLRDNRRRTPVIMLTGRTAVGERTTGLDSGADDYLTKPFEPDELSARIRALLRRQDTPQESVALKDVVLHPCSRQVLIHRNNEKLAPADFDLLLFLISNAGQAFSAEALLKRAWPSLPDATIPGLRMSMRRIRKLLENTASLLVIETVGDGYRAVK